MMTNYKNYQWEMNGYMRLIVSCGFVTASVANALLITTDGNGDMGLYVDNLVITAMSGSQSKMPVFNDLHLHCFTWKSGGYLKVVPAPGWCDYLLLG